MGTVSRVAGEHMASMHFKDLRDFTAFLEGRGELRRVSAEVDPHLEITAITDRICKRQGPALLFERPKGSSMPILMNAFGSYRRMSWALGVERLDEVGERIRELLRPEVPESMWEKLSALNRLRRFAGFQPKRVRSGPCQEVVIRDDVDLYEMPVLHCWPGDGGPFITLPLVFTKDPRTGRQNMGMYRLQVYDRCTTGMHWHVHHDGAANYHLARGRGQRMEVAVALGGDPATIYAATAPLPPMIDELLFAGFLRDEGVEVVRCQTVDLEVPAHAEIVLEGYVDAQETRVEGPFGDHTGYYSLADAYPVFHVQCITRRRDPIYPSTVVGRPPMEDCYMGKATERIFLPLLQVQLPEVVDINLPLEGVFHNCAILSIDKRYAGHAQKVMHAVWGMGQMMFTKMIVVVDGTVDAQDLSAVAWKVFNNVDPARDITVVKGPLDALDHSSNLPRFGSKIGIDATKKWPEEGHTRPWPDDIVMDPAVARLVDERWQSYGLD